MTLLSLYSLYNSFPHFIHTQVYIFSIYIWKDIFDIFSSLFEMHSQLRNDAKIAGYLITLNVNILLLSENKYNILFKFRKIKFLCVSTRHQLPAYWTGITGNYFGNLYNCVLSHSSVRADVPSRTKPFSLHCHKLLISHVSGLARKYPRVYPRAETSHV